MITMPFIFLNEVCEKFVVVGFYANMISYLTTQLHMPLTKAANTLTNFGGTASLTPLLGAFVVDAYAGSTLAIQASANQLAVALKHQQLLTILSFAMTSLTLSTILPQLRPPPCIGEQLCQQATLGQLAILYGSLLLGALGSGGIRPCVAAFGANQFDEIDLKQSTKTWKYFNWYYFVMGASILAVVTVIVYIQDNIGWGWGLGIPTISMFLSIIAFVLGYPLYRHMDPVGSPFTRLLQVSVGAFRKRYLIMVSDPNLLYQNEELDASIFIDGRLVHMVRCRLLDKTAIVTEEDNVKAPNLWRLNSVHRVEELKSLIRMGPIWASGILLITAYAQQGTFSLQQAKTMDRHLTNSFQIPAGSMSVFTMLAMLSTIALYDRFLIRIARRFTGVDRGITFLRRMGIGLLISVLATLVAGFIEVKRKQAAVAHGLEDKPHSIIPMSAFMSIGNLEFFYDQSPESMRISATALFWTAISVGNYVSTLLVSLVHKYSAKPDGSNWLPDNNLNKGKLELFYWLITGLQV
ncbi:hypothetical protein ERO13_D02G115400v2, partial [Gossypium hirsutum]